MCLGIPGRVVRWIDRRPIFASAEIEFDGVRRACQMACVPEAEEGDYVIVHAGVAIARVDAVEAERVSNELARIASGDDEGFEDSDLNEQDGP